MLSKTKILLTTLSNCFPAIRYPDIANYLVFGTNPFSAEDMKAYKSLNAYNQVLDGWVIDVKTFVTKSDLNIVRGKVRTLYYTLFFLTIFHKLPN